MRLWNFDPKSVLAIAIENGAIYWVTWSEACPRFQVRIRSADEGAHSVEDESRPFAARPHDVPVEST
jgi:hypothetical protein